MFASLLEYLPREGAVARDIIGESAEWALSDHLLAYIADGVWVANWQRGHGKKKDYPKPIPRPGDKSDKKAKAIGTVRTFAEIDAMRKKIRRG